MEAFTHERRRLPPAAVAVPATAAVRLSVVHAELGSRRRRRVRQQRWSSSSSSAAASPSPCCCSCPCSSTRTSSTSSHSTWRPHQQPLHQHRHHQQEPRGRRRSSSSSFSHSPSLLSALALPLLLLLLVLAPLPVHAFFFQSAHSRIGSRHGPSCPSTSTSSSFSPSALYTSTTPFQPTISSSPSSPSSSSSAPSCAPPSSSTVVPGRLRLESSVHNIPHPRKVVTGGEDAFFSLPLDVGVFDGVGGWSLVPEADTGLYSRLFANRTAFHLAQQRATGLFHVDHVAAFNYALRSTTDAIGSTTACVVSLSPSSRSLSGLNLGDSSFWLLRRKMEGGREEGREGGGGGEWGEMELDVTKKAGEGGREGVREGPWEVVFKTQMQTHDINMPYQLGTNCSDRPEFGQLFSLRTEPGDVLLLASDGLHDNLYENDILSSLSDTLPPSLPPSLPSLLLPAAAAALARRASVLSTDSSRVAPWQLSRALLSQEKKKALHPFTWKRKEREQAALCGLDENGRPLRALGGKQDDITVVLARVH